MEEAAIVQIHSRNNEPNSGQEIENFTSIEAGTACQIPNISDEEQPAEVNMTVIVPYFQGSPSISYNFVYVRPM